MWRDVRSISEACECVSVEAKVSSGEASREVNKPEANVGADIFL